MNHHIHMQPSQHRAMLSWIFFGGCCMSMHDMATPLVRATWPHLQWQQQSAVKHLANETMIWYSSLEWPDVTYVFLLMKPMLFNCFISETTLLSFIFSLSLPILYVLSCVLLLILEIPSPCHHARTPMPCPMGPWPYIPFMYVCVCVWGRGGAGRVIWSRAGRGHLNPHGLDGWDEGSGPHRGSCFDRGSQGRCECVDIKAGEWNAIARSSEP